jgi:hypothetical protein
MVSVCLSSRRFPVPVGEVPSSERALFFGQRAHGSDLMGVPGQEWTRESRHV